MKKIKREIEEYINQYDEEIAGRLLKIREKAFELLPEADEAIKYRMPTIIWNGNVFHYAAFKNHIGIYPLPHVLEELKDMLKGYKQGKGSIQFKNNEELPIDVIEKIIKARIEDKKQEGKEGK
ncbi:MAG: DUF1801 domain-containing protein [Treponema sp.]|nr:DUF1801 domain-containing protein [Treponema sp.]